MGVQFIFMDVFFWQEDAEFEEGITEGSKAGISITYQMLMFLQRLKTTNRFERKGRRKRLKFLN